MRKLKRTLVNGARADLKKHAKKELLEIIKFNLDEDRDKEIDRRRDNELAKSIYIRWKQKFINTPIHPDDVAQSMNELAAELENKLTFKETARWIIENLVYPAIESTHMVAEAIKNRTVKVQGFCPKCNMLLATDVLLKAWHLRQFELVCPDCDPAIGRIPGEECSLVEKKRKKR